MECIGSCSKYANTPLKLIAVVTDPGLPLDSNLRECLVFG